MHLRFSHTFVSNIPLVFLITITFVVNGYSQVVNKDSDVITSTSNNPSKNLSDHIVQYQQDIQGISVIDYSGNYDKNINGLSNVEARQAILQEFYQHQADEYDFVYIFTEFEFDTGAASAFASNIMNDVEGIGKPIYDNRSSYFTEKLQTIIDMGALNRRNFILSSSGYDDLLSIMMHEMMHRWGIDVKYLDAQNQISDRLLGRDNAHWSYFLNSNASVMYGALWDETTSGNFKTVDIMHGLSPLDLYLAGFVDKDSVADTFLIDDASSGAKTDIPSPIGTEIDGTKEMISINDIIAYEGERTPNFANAQHIFKVKFILLKSPDDELKPQSIANLYVLQNEFQKRFFAETNGVGQIDFPKILDNNSISDPGILIYDSLLNNDFDLPSAVDFILRTHHDEWWQDRNSTKVRDTVTVIKALQLIIDDFPEVQSVLSTSILWLNNYQPQNNDEISWMLSSGVLQSEVKLNLISSIGATKFSSGGWGFNNITKASPYDTALIVDGLIQAQGTAFNLDLATKQFVVNNINPDSGFPYVAGGESNVSSSALLLKSMLKISSDPQLFTDLVGYILSQTLPDNSYGMNGSGTPHETAEVIQALESLQDNNYQPQIDSAKLALNSMQSGDGSMQGSLYSTALTISVFNANTKANLHFNSASLSNNNVIAGEQILVDFDLINSGVVDANNIDISVFRDNVDVNNQIGQTQINLLEANQTISASIPLNTTGFTQTNQIIVVIDFSNSIQENNEDDNIYTLELMTQEINSEPELAFNQGLFSIASASFNVLPYNLNASITVSNLSLTDVENVQVDVSKVETNGDLTVLQSQTFNIPSLTEKEFIFNVDIEQASNDIPVVFTIDPANEIAERNEENNTHQILIERIVSTDISISNQNIEIPDPVIAGQANNISFNIHNKGTSNVGSFIARVYAEINNESQLIHQSQVVDLNPGMLLNRSFNWQPLSQGDYNLRFVIDEDNELAENDEINNEVIVATQVLTNALSNISIDTDDLVITPDPGLTGQDLNFSLNIHNDSTVDTPTFGINIYQKNTNGTPNTLLASIADVASIAAQTNQIVSLTLANISLTGQHTIIIKIDANDEIIEFNENDNIIIKDIRILIKPDAYVSSGGFQLAPTIPVLGEPLSVVVTVRNIGEQDLSDLSASLYYENSQVSNPVLIDTQNISLLSGGQSQNLNFEFIYPNDTSIDTLFIVLDELDNINEGNESNNQASINVNNQDRSLYVSNQYFSPNGDSIKDDTRITFNTNTSADYEIQILDVNSNLIRKLNPTTFLNTNFGDTLWDGKSDKGIVARDGDYTIELVNQNGNTINTTVVTLDTNRTPQFDSIINGKQKFTDLNCLGHDFRSIEFSKDGRSIYTSYFIDANNITQHGLFKIKEDGSRIDPLIPSQVVGNAITSHYSVLDNGNIFIILTEQDTHRLLLKNITNGTLTTVSPDITGDINVLAVENEFVIIGTGSEYQKIFLNGITAKQIKTGYQNTNRIINVNSGILIGFSTNDLQFISYDFNQNPSIIFNDVDQYYSQKSHDGKYFIYEDESSIYLFSAEGTEFIHLITKNKGFSHSSALTIHNDLFVINNDATISIYNTQGDPLLVTQKTYTLEQFDNLLNSASPTTTINDQQVSLFIDDITESHFTQKLIGHVDASDKKESIIILENSLYATFNVQPCDDNIYVCDLGQPWPSSISNILVGTNRIFVKINYESLLNLKFEISDSDVTFDDFHSTQEGRSDKILFTGALNFIQQFLDINNINHTINDFVNTGLIRIDANYPNKNIIETINKMVIDYRDIEGIEGFNCPITNTPKYLMRSKNNLYADVNLVNSQQGIEITATAIDKNFDHYELSWSSSLNPNQWNFLQSSFDSIEDTIVLNWVPLESALYRIKIKAYDKAGNSYEDIESIVINNVNSAIRNIDISPLYFSPNGDGIIDEAIIRYDITSAVELLIEIQNESGTIVKTFEREYLSAQSENTILWDGKDIIGNVLPDGRYSVIIQGYQYEVNIDTKGIVLDTDLYLDLGGPGSYINSVTVDITNIINKLTIFDDYSSHVLQFYDAFTLTWEDYNDNLFEVFDYDNLTETINGDYRLKTLDKAGNVGITNILKPTEQFIQIQLKKITDSNEHLTNKFMYPSIYNPRPSLDIVDWNKGNKIAYVIQPLNLESFNSVKLLLNYFDDTGKSIETSQFVDPANFSIVSQYFGSEYLEINTENSDVHNVIIDASENGCIYTSSGILDENNQCSLIDGDTSQYEHDSIPIILIELDKNNFPDIENAITVQFAFDSIRSTATSITFKKSSSDTQVSSKLLTFDYDTDIQGLTIQEQEAYNQLINTIPFNSDFEYIWIFQNDNTVMINETFTVTHKQNGNIIQVENLNPDYVDSAEDYISRLYTLIPESCQISKDIQWNGINDTGDIFETGIPISNTFCIESELNTSFYLGEFCANAAINSPNVKFDINVDVNNSESSLPVLVELYRITELSDELIYSDTNPQLLLTDNNLLNYHHTLEINPTSFYSGLQKFKLLVTDATGNKKISNNQIYINSTMVSNQIINPIANSQYCADKENGQFNINISASLDNQELYGARTYLIVNGVNSDLIHMGFNSFNEIGNQLFQYTSNSPFHIPNYSGNATLLLETFNSQGVSYCSSVNVNVDSLVEYSLLEDVPTNELGRMRNIFSPNSDGVKDTFKLANIQALENLSVDIQLFHENDPNTSLGSLMSATINNNMTEEFIWDGTLNGSLVNEGRYNAVITLTDDCGLTHDIHIPISIDTTAPISTFVNPLDGSQLHAVEQIIINIQEDNLTDGTYDARENIAVEYFYNNVWNGIEIQQVLNPSNGNYEIQLDWNLTNLPAANYPLRITAIDAVGNGSTEQINPELIESQNIFWNFNVSPLFISPNADNIKDKVYIVFGLNVEAIVNIDVLDEQLNPVTEVLSNQLYPAGSQQIIYNGMDSSGSALVDGFYTINISASEASNLTNSASLSLNFTIDNQAPLIHWQAPLANVTKAQGTAKVQLNESNPKSFVVTNQQLQPITAPIELLNTRQSGEFNLFDFALINETTYQLYATATDLAGNITTVSLDYIVDKTAPDILLNSPVNDAFIGGNNNNIAITGTINDNNFDHYELSITENNTNQWQSIYTDTELTETHFDYQWQPSVNDGIYQLKLSAFDQAGWLTETSIDIIVDKTSPLAQIIQPTTNSLVGNAITINGVATDDNFKLYTLSYKLDAPSELWHQFAIGQSPVMNSTLGILPSSLQSASYDIKLTVVDKVGLISETIVPIVIDVSPPSIPQNFTAEIINNNQVALSWDLVTDNDLAGYIIYRNGSQLNLQTALIDAGVNQYIDNNLSDGDYVYQIIAVDNLGNYSDFSESVSISIDNTPPIVNITNPVTGQKINNNVEIRGTAFSLLDFNSYDLYIRPQSQPAPGMLLNHSVIPVSNDIIGNLDTLGLTQNTEHVIRLEAKDNSDNIAFIEQTIYVDNIAPNSPMNLTHQIQNDNDVFLQWDANSESDLAGYLVLFNGIVISGAGNGDLTIGNAIMETNWTLTGVNDGTHTFNVLAIDETGNVSAYSNTIEITINTRPPDTTIITPYPGQKFDTPILFEASSEDTDLSEIKFEYSLDNNNWVLLDTDFLSPYQVTINPITLNLNYGNVYLRATATDTSSQVDVSPAQLMIEYADISPPQAVKNVTSHIEGGQITLHWDENSESDLQGYLIYSVTNGVKVLITPSAINLNEFTDSGLSDAIYNYEISAIDISNNESEAVPINNLQIFSIDVDQPFTPLLTPAKIQLSGRSTLQNGEIEISLQNDMGTQSIPNINLNEITEFLSTEFDLEIGSNITTINHKLSESHISKTKTIQVDVSPEPNPPLNFQAIVNGFDSELTWQTPDTNTFGYLPYKNGNPALPISQLLSGISATTSSNESYALYAIDNDPETIWSPASSDLFLKQTIDFEINIDQKRWLTGVEIDWLDDFEFGVLSPRSYFIQYYSGNSWVTIADLSKSNEPVVTTNTELPYLTNKLRLVINNPDRIYQNIQLKDIKLLHQELLNQTAMTITETDGTYDYSVTSINNYGFESVASNIVQLEIGDVVPPETVMLSGVQIGNNDAQLSWDASVSSDVARYWIFRNNELLNITADASVLTYTDIGLTNGDFEYYVRALDSVGNPSQNSNVVNINIQLQALPVIENLNIYSALSGAALILDWDTVQSSRFHHYNVYRSLTSGGPYIKINEVLENHYQDEDVSIGVTYYYTVTMVDEFENQSDYSTEVSSTPIDSIPANTPIITSPTVNGTPINVSTLLTNIKGTADAGVLVDLYLNDVYQTTVSSDINYDSTSKYLPEDLSNIRLSKNGEWYAFNMYEDFTIKNINNDVSLSTFSDLIDYTWNLDGTFVYLIAFDDQNGDLKLSKYDVNLNEVSQLIHEDELISAVPSADENLIFYQGNYSDPQTNLTVYGLWIFDVQNSTAIEVANTSGFSTRNTGVAWSNDGKYIAIIDDNTGELYLYELDSQALTLIDSGLRVQNTLSWSPDSRTLLYDGTKSYDLSSAQIIQIPSINNSYRAGQFSADGNNIAYQQDCCSISIYNRNTQISNMVYSGVSNIKNFTWNNDIGIEIATTNEIVKIVTPGSFSFNNILLDPGLNQVHVVARDGSGIASEPSLPIYIDVEATGIADLAIHVNDLIISPKTGIQGSQFIASVIFSNNGDDAVIDAEITASLFLPNATVEDIPLSINRVNLLSGESQSLFIDIGELTSIGEYTLQVSLDPHNEITESNENNNNVFDSLVVLENFYPVIQMFVSPEIVTPQQTVNAQINVFNPAEVFNGFINLNITDSNGFPIGDQQQFNITNLDLNETQNIDYNWDTNNIFSGVYQFTAELWDDNGQLLGQQTSQVEIISYAQFDLILDMPINSVSENESIFFSATINYLNGNVSQHGSIFWEILDDNQQQVWNNETTLPEMLAGFNTTINNQWLAQNAGEYVLKIQFNTDNFQETKSVPFEVIAAQEEIGISGQILSQPNSIILGSDFTLSYHTTNTGNIDLNNIPISIKLLNTDLSTTLIEDVNNISLLTGDSQIITTQIFSSESLILNNYLIGLYADMSTVGGSANQLLDTRSISTVDATAPEIIIISPIPNSLNSANVDINFSVSDLNGLVSSIYLQGTDINQGDPLNLNINSVSNNYQYQLFNLQDGIHQMTITAIDNFGNQTQKQLSFSIDSSAPVISISGVSDDQYYNDSVTTNVMIADENLIDSSILLNAQLIPNVHSITEEGNYFLSVRAEDSVGNISTQNLNFSIDLTAPVVTILFPEENAEIENTTTSVNGNTEAHSLVELSVGTYQTSTYSDTNGDFYFTEVPLTIGNNSINIFATDRANNQSVISTRQVISVEPFDVQGILDVSAQSSIENDYLVDYSLINYNTQNWMNLAVKIELYNVNSGALIDTQNDTIDLLTLQTIHTSMTFSTATLMPDNYQLNLSIFNDNQWQQKDTKIIQLADTSAPIISVNSPTMNQVTNNELELSIEVTDQYSTVVDVTYEIDGSTNWLPMVDSGNDVYIANIMLNHGNHTVKFKAVDSANNSEQSSSLQIETDTIAPIITVNAPNNGNIGNQSVILDFQASDDHQYQMTALLNNVAVNSGDTIVNEGEYTLIVTATDEVGNQSQSTTQFIIDKTVPTVTVTNIIPGQEFIINGISVKGLTEPHANITINNGTTQDSTTSNELGEFEFTNYTLIEGNNELVLIATDLASNQSLPVSITVNYNQTDACDVFGFKSAAAYDAFVFANFTAQSSEVEGRLAAGNNINIKRYKIAQQLTAETAGDVLVSGGDINFAHEQAYYGNILASGDANIGQTVIDNMYPETQILGNTQIPINFTESYQQLKLFSQALSELPANSTATLINQELQLQGECMAELQAYSIEATDLQNFSTITYDCLAENSYMIFNVTGENIQFNHVDLSSLYPIRNRIIWNFFEADTVVIHNIGIQGSMLAIDALITGDEPLFIDGFENVNQTPNKSALGAGYINGQVISRDFNSQQKINHQALECHGSILVDATPIATNQTFSIEINTPITFDLDVIDENSASLHYQLISQVSEGQLTGQMPNLTYTPANNYEGVVSFEYQVTDQFGKTTTAMVSIEVIDSSTTMKSIALFNNYLFAATLNLLINGILWRRK